ncbi:MAG TPA: beta-L-arabinofuranosidase domain-containing protein [Terriglobales bacterium]|nr:beta-L-arabinofuranosidase domain-containing protein [Terriglobales bacterium]
MSHLGITRRKFLGTATLSVAGAAVVPFGALPPANASSIAKPLEEFRYGQVKILSELHEAQLRNCISVLMSLSEDSLLKPMRQMGGQPAPGDDLGGWYNYEPNYDWHTFDSGFAPGATFGQWVSALARAYAITGSAEIRNKVLRLNRLYAASISDGFFEKNRFPAYCYDKLTCGLIDSQYWAGDPNAFAILRSTTETALRHMPEHAVEHGQSWRPGKDISWNWDESYTVPENQFIAYQRGAGEQYKELGSRYLNDSFFRPLSEGENVLAGKHAYSHVNALSSAMQAYLTLGSEMHLQAAKNAFDMLTAQSFATGGWGPDELLRATGSQDIESSLTKTHASFETPCGSYAHFKITRYLLQVTGDSRYGDSMERVMYNTVLGAKPLEPDGRAFYYSDYNFDGRKVYSNHRWPCCSGTLPQVATDYGISTYFRDARGVYVNLYLTSNLRWDQSGAEAVLSQKSSYPNEGNIEFEFSLSKPAEFSASFRIPAWAETASIFINGKRFNTPLIPGTFASVRREWRNGDRVELALPMKLRLEALDPKNPNIVALLRGPLVLFPIAPVSPNITRKELLTSTKSDGAKWRAKIANGATTTMMPFTAINDEAYSTYFNLRA